jgi:hypothetical protein
MSPMMVAKWQACKQWSVEFMLLASKNVHTLVETTPAPLDVLDLELQEQIFDELMRGTVAGKALTQVLITLARLDLTEEQKALANELITSIHKDIQEGMVETT